MRAKKHLGQHFLSSKAVLRDMLTAAHITHEDTVLEIGPGKGVLTRALLETGATVYVVEKDEDMIPHLEKTFEEYVHNKQLTLICGDILDINIAEYISKEYKLVANIPYYITGEIIRRFLTSQQAPLSMTLLVQKEVAERIAKSKKETVLSLSVKAYGNPRYVSTVPARYFNPPPKVDSALLHIADISKNFFFDIDEKRFFKLVKAGFSSKRKKLLNNLSSFSSKENLLEALTSLGLPESTRAEDVQLHDWASLTRSLT